MTNRQNLTHRQFKSLGIAAPLLLLLAAACSPAASAPPPEIPELLPVSAMAMQAVGEYHQTLHYTGRVEADQRSAVSFEGAGKLIDVMVDEGDTVRAGQALAQLDVARLELDLAALVAQSEQAEARLQEFEAGPRLEQLEAQRALVSEREANWSQVRRDAERQQALLADGVSSQEVADSFAARATAAAAQLEAARQRLLELERGTRIEQIAAQKALLRQLQAQADRMRLEIQRATLLAPFDGVVVSRSLDPGVMVAAGSSPLTLQSSRQLRVKIGVPQQTAAELKLGSHYPLKFEQQTLEAELVAILPQVDPRTYSQTIILQLTSGHALPGQTVEWTHRVRNEVSGYWVPSTALIPGRRGLWASLMLDQHGEGQYQVRRQEVQILHTEADRVLLHGGGIEEGELFVSSGVDRVVPGQIVRINQEVRP